MASSGATVEGDEILRLKNSNVSNLEMFVCTLSANIVGLQYPDFDDIATRICTPCNYPYFIAVNSNCGHYCRPGYELYLKVKKVKKARKSKKSEKGGKIRCLQGDGTCFNSAIEPIISIVPVNTGAMPDKVYRVKCFPSTGEVQIPGIINQDLSDGDEVIKILVEYIRHELAAKFSDTLTSFPTVDRKITNVTKIRKLTKKVKKLLQPPPTVIEDPPTFSTRPTKLYSAEEIKGIGFDNLKPILINYKFIFKIPFDYAIGIHNLFNYLQFIQNTLIVENDQIINDPQAGVVKMYIGGEEKNILIDSAAEPMPPMTVRELNKRGVKVAFKFNFGDHLPKINIFQSGKVNILGLNNPTHSRLIYDYLCAVFERNWDKFIIEMPRPDPVPQCQYCGATENDVHVESICREEYEENQRREAAAQEDSDDDQY